MKSFIMSFLFAMTIFFTLFNHSLVGDPKFCPGTFTANDVCANIHCGILALSQWPASKMPHSCICAASGSNQSLCTCQIVC
ncbi:hypothetical protein EJD97_014503 [Solanum chilense]|uniref:Hydrophobic seed protein domain-containing protein n=1 Tax=Solanum chilense TaxID=4083 RepID=A0A6N2B8W1_SOLCI|nr:hypothetical protein EJD97_014503 [Solanum chilense]